MQVSFEPKEGFKSRRVKRGMSPDVPGSVDPRTMEVVDSRSVRSGSRGVGHGGRDYSDVISPPEERSKRPFTTER